MKVDKELNRNGGYFIYVEIGTRVSRSYWSAPPTSIDHVDLDYLKNRYAMINTNKKEVDFKRLYKNMWIETTEYQNKIMKHCIGLDYKKKPYRNRYQTQHTDEDWNDLIQKGLAKMSDDIADNGLTWFWLTQQGVEYIIGKSVSKKVYEDL